LASSKPDPVGECTQANGEIVTGSDNKLKCIIKNGRGDSLEVQLSEPSDPTQQSDAIYERGCTNSGGEFKDGRCEDSNAGTGSWDTVDKTSGAETTINKAASSDSRAPVVPQPPATSTTAKHPRHASGWRFRNRHGNQNRCFEQGGWDNLQRSVW
jgi:hypothetical protein